MRTPSALLGRQPTRRWNMERQQFLHGPPVLSDGGGHGRSAGSRGPSPSARQARLIAAIPGHAAHGDPKGLVFSSAG